MRLLVLLLFFAVAHAELTTEEKMYIDEFVQENCSIKANIIKYPERSEYCLIKMGRYQQEGYWINNKSVFIPKKNSNPCLTPFGKWAIGVSILSLCGILYYVLPIINRCAKDYVIARLIDYALANMQQNRR